MVHHNMGLNFQDQGDLEKALEEFESAVTEAVAAGNRRLAAATRGGRAETRLLQGDAEFARREIERVLAAERELGDVVNEAEDLRVLAGTLAESNGTEQAEELFKDVILRAEHLNRPVLAAQAERDLAHLLRRLRRDDEAKEHARQARVRFEHVGAAAQVEKLDKFLSEGAAKH
jgi:tetratricopeptide (TPR) repeat protein